MGKNSHQEWKHTFTWYTLQIIPTENNTFFLLASSETLNRILPSSILFENIS